MRYTFHDFRRLFITDAIMHGMPPHIAQLVAGHRDINTTMGYKAVYPEEVINGHRAFVARRRALRPGEEYRTPTDEEWAEFVGHFEHRKVSVGDCGRSYDTPCIHEHSCLSELDHSSRYVRFWGHGDGVRPARSVKVGMPSWMVLARRRRVASIWASLSSAPARLTLSPSTSPSQPSRSASAMRACRLSRISSSRARCAGSGRRSGHLTQACSWTQGVA